MSISFLCHIQDSAIICKARLTLEQPLTNAIPSIAEQMTRVSKVENKIKYIVLFSIWHHLKLRTIENRFSTNALRYFKQVIQRSAAPSQIQHGGKRTRDISLCPQDSLIQRQTLRRFSAQSRSCGTGIRRQCLRRQPAGSAKSIQWVTNRFPPPSFSKSQYPR